LIIKRIEEENGMLAARIKVDDSKDTYSFIFTQLDNNPELKAALINKLQHDI